MYYIGIDIGSTAAKTVLFHNDDLIDNFVMPTGWSSTSTANEVKEKILERGIDKEDIRVVATGYGRISVPFADKTVTEITCHGLGASQLMGEDCTVIDIGGQDTKIISVVDGKIVDFLMNDKCSAGTGRFLEIMANTIGVDITGLCDIARKGSGLTISTMCTVFAESEVISLIGRGESKEDIAYGIVDSIVSKVANLAKKHSHSNNYYLTGGLCDCPYIIEQLGEKLLSQIKTDPMARYAGAIGAGLLAKKIK